VSRDDDCFACAGIPSEASGLPSHGELAKVGNRNWFPLLQRCLEEFKKPIHELGRLSFWDPHLPIDSRDNIQLAHSASIFHSAATPSSPAPTHAHSTFPGRILQVVSDSGVRQYYPSDHHQSRYILSVTDPSAVTSLPTGPLFESYSDSWLESCEARGLESDARRAVRLAVSPSHGYPRLASLSYPLHVGERFPLNACMISQPHRSCCFRPRCEERWRVRPTAGP